MFKIEQSFRLPFIDFEPREFHPDRIEILRLLAFAKRLSSKQNARYKQIHCLRVLRERNARPTWQTHCHVGLTCRNLIGSREFRRCELANTRSRIASRGCTGAADPPFLRQALAREGIQRPAAHQHYEKATRHVLASFSFALQTEVGANTSRSVIIRFFSIRATRLSILEFRSINRGRR